MIYVHIGMFKSGSTTVQSFMAEAAELLSARNVLYPEVGRGKGVAHHALAKALDDFSAPNAQAAWREAREFFKVHADSTIVLSSEAFESVNPEKLREALGNTRTKIICYIRENTKRLPSAYTQNTKYGLNLANFDQYFDGIQVTTSPKWGYSKLLLPWAVAFGPESVRVRSLDPSVLHDSDLIQDFLSTIGLREFDSLQLSEAAGRLNVSPGWKTIETLRAVHRHLDKRWSVLQRRQNRVVWRYLRSTFDQAEMIARDLGWVEQGLYLTRFQNELLVDMHNEEILKLEKLGIDVVMAAITRDPSLEREFLPDVSHVPPDEVGSFLLQLMPAQMQRLLQLASAGRARSLRGWSTGSAPAEITTPR